MHHRRQITTKAAKPCIDHCAHRGRSRREPPSVVQHATDGRPARPAAPVGPVPDEFLDVLAGIHLGRVDVAAGIDTHLVQHVELAGSSAVSTKTTELLERVAVQHVYRLVRIVTHVETGLFGIS